MDSYAQAKIGPIVAGLPSTAGGYTALSYTNNSGVVQEYFIEFNETNGSTLTTSYDIWDFTVYDGTTLKEGRLYSKAWGINSLGDGLFSTEFAFYGLIPSPFGDFYVKKIDFAQMQPLGAFIYLNEFGADTSYSKDYEERRKSIPGTLSGESLLPIRNTKYL